MNEELPLANYYFLSIFRTARPARVEYEGGKGLSQMD